MNIQIIGNKKCSATQKAMRFFKERNVSYHFLDLNEKALSKGELTKIAQKLGGENLIDSSSKAFRDKGLAWMDYEPLEEIMENNLLLKTPVVRNGNDATAGLEQKIWTAWIKEGK